jgi:hypothetical protein
MVKHPVKTDWVNNGSEFAGSLLYLEAYLKGCELGFAPVGHATPPLAFTEAGPIEYFGA